ncbi:family 16 glycoside hydrolase [Reichenbachiella sp. MALMAid0571]|uniref:family 16 glycoside hydrolase n=1 Tax=Reichenbachiella sp. MALMAid0571 TaxID=3143939 RepID=UPI0032DEE0E7
MRILLCAVVIAFANSVMAQTQLSLENLDDFKPQAGNWQIVGDVVMNRQVDVHYKPEPTADSKKKKKKKDVVEELQAVTFTAGTGILLNINNKEKKDKLITDWEHGDIELELEVMMPKGSNSGIYLQGRYEIQLLDSWGVKSPKFTDIGGIYQSHGNDYSKKMIGIPPTTNAAKAPGLWQKMKIHFQAPRFDAAGNKIKNAKFVSVDLNGVRIHTNADVTLPTGGPISGEEVAMGPLVIQGDHGPVAIKNIKYKLLADSKVEMNGLTFKSYHGEFKGIEEFENEKPVKEGSTSLIDVSLAGDEDNYALIFSGSLVIPETDEYTFSVGYTGGVKFVLNNETIVENLSSSAQGNSSETLKLNSGTYPFTIYNYKSAEWRASRLGLSIKGNNSNKKSFHQYDSYPEKPSSVSPIFVNAEQKPRLLRAFVSFEGSKKLSHTIGVGTPDGLNYVYDLNSANLIGVWRGDFVDATPMWHNRGNATFEPRGAVQWTFLNQPLAELSSEESPFPDKADFADFKPKGYVLDKASGLPVFKHIYKGVEIENKVVADASETYLIHEVAFSQSNLSNWYYKVADGNIRKMPDGSYAINDQQYYVNVLSGQVPKIRTIDNVQELVLPVDGSKIKYEIIW